MLNNLFNFQLSLLYGKLMPVYSWTMLYWRSSGSFPALGLCLSPVLWRVSRRRMSPLSLDYAQWNQPTSSHLRSHNAFYSLSYCLFSALSFSKCGSLALYTLVPDQIVAMCNENDTSYLDWQYMIQQTSLLYSASCWHPKSPDTYTSLTFSRLSTQDLPVHSKNSF